VTDPPLSDAPRADVPQADVPLLEVRDVRRQYHAHGSRATVNAVDGVSFSVMNGETVGLVGESGCGKSTLARMLMGLEPVTDGEILFSGDVIRLSDRSQIAQLRREVQIVFQDPYSSLNPRYSVRRTLSEVLIVRGIRDREARRRRVDELLELVGLRTELGDRHARELSGGQRQRVVIARALAVEPKMIIADEAVSALDVSVQAQVLNLFSRLQDELGLTYLFISHDLDVVRHLCSRVLVMYLGRIVETGSVGSVLGAPHHPYTRALLDSLPSLDAAVHTDTDDPVKGELPNPIDPPSGCHFHPRCAIAVPRCRTESPPLMPQDDGMAACFLAGSDVSDRVAQV
jgi:oligopeptide/dipeptide ABC transporter ATP-binding protein